MPRATDAEIREFHRIWELFRNEDRRWPLERDRFERRSDAAAYLLAGHLLKYYTGDGRPGASGGDRREGDAAGA